MIRKLLPILLLLTLVLPGCRPVEQPDVMSEVTFVLESDTPLPVTRASYQIRYHNHNTRLSTTRSSISATSYTDQLYRGLYDVQVEGTLLLESGEVAWVRGSARGQLFLDPHETCHIKLSRMR